MEKMKVLFHVNEAERWNAALGNITNLLNDVGKDAVDIVLIANGQGVNAFAEGEKVSAMSDFAEQGIQFCALNSFRPLSRSCRPGLLLASGNSRKGMRM